MDILSSEFTSTYRDRAKGAFLGLALGDALGTTLEFSPRDTYLPLTDLVGGGPFHLAPGEWTDDTSMALCLAESLLESGFDPIDQAKKYLLWMQEGRNSVNGCCFDIGNTTRSALLFFNNTGSLVPSQYMHAGNGAIMRLAPIPIRYGLDRATATTHAKESSRVTHYHDDSIYASSLMTYLMVDGLYGKDKNYVLKTRSICGLPDSVASIANGDYKSKSRSDISSAGLAVDTLEAALWAFHNSSSWKEGALLAVNLGVDSDTVGAVYGQIAGSVYGMSGLPTDWLLKLAWKEHFERVTDQLVDHALADYEKSLDA